jgi:hypothetical protein
MTNLIIGASYTAGLERRTHAPSHGAGIALRAS